MNYFLASEGFVSLKVYDIPGNEVRALAEDRQSAGIPPVKFDALGLASGVYMYRLRGL